MKTIITIFCVLLISSEASLADSVKGDSNCSFYENIESPVYKKNIVKELIANLNSKDAGLRWEAAGSLPCFGEMAASSIPLMIPLFKEPIGEARGDMISAVARFGKLAVPSLLKTLKEKDIDIRRGSCEALGKIGSPAADAIPELLRLLNEPGHDVSHSAAYALGSIGKAAIPSLLEVIRNGPEPNRRLVVQNSFSRVAKDDLPKDDLLVIMVSPTQSPEARQAATQALGYYNSNRKDKIPDLVNMMGRKEGGLGLAAARVLAAEGNSAVPAIMRALSSPDSQIRTSATYAVQYLYLPLEEAIPILISLLDDTEPTVRYGASMALQRIGTTDAVAAVNRFKQKQQK